MGGNVLKAGGEDLGLDNTAVCHTESKFTCEGAEKDYENLANAGKCKEVESTKVDKMCDDGPCDNDENSDACKLAKAKCEVDPETGSMCMPGNENDPCADCVRAKTCKDTTCLTSEFCFCPQNKFQSCKSCHPGCKLQKQDSNGHNICVKANDPTDIFHRPGDVVVLHGRNLRRTST